MALGFEGYVTLKVNVDESMALGTGASVPQTRQRIESQSGYGGKIKTPVNEMGIAYPKAYDWTGWDGSMDFELNYEFLKKQLQPWMFDRQKGAEVKIRSRNANLQYFSKAYWSNINLTATTGAAVTGSVSFMSTERDTYAVGGDYFTSPRGAGIFGAPGGLDFPPPLNPSGESISPFAYWKTSIYIDGNKTEFTTWALDFSQDAVKFFSCENNVNAAAPKFLAMGPMTVSFTGDYMFVDVAGFAIPFNLVSLYVYLDDLVIKLEGLELQTDTDAMQGPGDITPINVEYAAYQLVA
jgi:hypothetical protein